MLPFLQTILLPSQGDKSSLVFIFFEFCAMTITLGFGLKFGEHYRLSVTGFPKNFIFARSRQRHPRNLEKSWFTALAFFSDFIQKPPCASRRMLPGSFFSIC